MILRIKRDKRKVDNNIPAHRRHLLMDLQGYIKDVSGVDELDSHTKKQILDILNKLVVSIQRVNELDYDSSSIPVMEEQSKVWLDCIKKFKTFNDHIKTIIPHNTWVKGVQLIHDTLEANKELLKSIEYIRR